jgi:nucleoside-diphosphate-sugar epimerase
VSHAAWDSVQQITADRHAEDAAGTFRKRIVDLKPDVVIDLICYTMENAQQLVAALRGNVQQLLHCGTVWIYGHSTAVPASEDQPRRPIGDYGTRKSAILDYLLKEARQNGFPVTALHPGHIVGPGWNPINPAGHANPEVFAVIGRGEELALPHFGMETVHHVHAVDVAQSFMKAMTHWNASIGESFHVVSSAALTLRGFAEATFAWFGHEPKLKFMPWDEWKATVSEADAQGTWEHIYRSPNASIEKARRLIGYEPRYTSLEAIFESVSWLIAHGKIVV